MNNETSRGSPKGRTLDPVMTLWGSKDKLGVFKGK